MLGECMKFHSDVRNCEVMADKIGAQVTDHQLFMLPVLIMCAVDHDCMLEIKGAMSLNKNDFVFVLQ